MTFALRDIPAARQQWQPRLWVCRWVLCPQSQSLGCLVPVWAVLVEQSQGSSTALLPQDGNTRQCCCPGTGGREGVVKPVKQSGCYCCWKIKGSCKQSGRAFTFTLVFPVWSMPKCRTWKSASGEGEMCIYSIKSRPYGDICDVNSSITVLMYLMWCDSAEATVPLDWFIQAESSAQSQICYCFPVG